MKLPGLATFSALLLAVVLTAWLGIAGPVNLEAVRGWQTLIAAGIALIAATIAWNAAMAKLRFDEGAMEITERRKRLATLFRADLAINELRETVFAVENELEDMRANPFFAKQWSAERLRIEEPREFEVVWDNLDIFPRTIIRQLATVRHRIRVINSQVVSLQGDITFPVNIRDAEIIDNVRKLVVELERAGIALTPLIEEHTD
jgi:hypothetical protein